MSLDRQDPYQEGAVAARARRMRSLGIALLLVVFVAIVFTVAILKLSGRG